MKRAILTILLLAAAPQFARAQAGKYVLPRQSVQTSGAAWMSSPGRLLHSSFADPLAGVSKNDMRILYSGYISVENRARGNPRIIVRSTVNCGSAPVASSKRTRVKLANSGALPLDIAGMTTYPPNVFSLDSGGSTMQIPGLDSSDIIILFTADSVGDRHGTLRIISNDNDDSLSIIPLLGYGYQSAAAVIELSADTLYFAATRTGESDTLDLGIHNSGNAPLSLASQSVSGDAYSIQTQAAGIIDPNASGAARIVFSPVSQGLHIGKYTVNSNAANRPSAEVRLFGNAISTGLRRLEQSPSGLVLHESYPNPVSARNGHRANIRYELNTEAEVRLTVFDMLGRKTALLVDGRQSTGVYIAEFDARSLPTGVYIVELCAGAGARRARVAVVR